MGLLGMEERARRLGMRLRVENVAERGSKVTVEAPVDLIEAPVDATSDREA